MKLARARDLLVTNPHGVAAPIDDPDAVEEVLAVARQAYDAAKS